MNTTTLRLTLLSVLSALLFSVFAFAQQDVRTVSMTKLNQQKKAGLLTGREYYVNHSSPKNPFRVTPITPHVASTSCNCWIDRDGSWTIGPFDDSGGNGGPGVAPNYRNDDWSTAMMTLPFNFCFYGSPITQVYLNNNGNITIGAASPIYNASGFPNNNDVMVAPFWADVDTRGGGSGLVYYKLTATHLIVQWDMVGYFDSYDDKLNTFQLIMTDGIDTLLPLGQNVSFCYKDMQWTTGDASGGTNGFGGTPATVGVNQGNGVDFIQLGLFDQAGSAYDGPGGNNDGIDVLDNQSYVFNVCFSGTNVPPIVNSVQVCDTLTVCERDTLYLTANYLSPEAGQITTGGVNPNGMTGVSLFSNTPGNVANMVVQVIGLASNLGYNTIFLTGTDDGIPVQTTSTPMVIHVIPSPLAAFTYLPASPVLPGTLVTFTNGTTGATSYVWNFGDGSATSALPNPQHTYNTPGTYTITLTATGANGCTDVHTFQITVVSCATANITGGTTCTGVPVQVSYVGTASSQAMFNWNFAGGTIVSGTGGGPYMVSWNTAGTYNISLTVVDTSCTAPLATTTVTVNANPVATVSATPVICIGDQNVISFTGTALGVATYTWNFAGAVIVSGTGQGPYTVLWNNAGTKTITLIVSQNGCSDTGNFVVTVNPIPTSTFTMPSAICNGVAVPITYTGTAPSNATYSWNFGGATILSGTGQGPYSIRWNTAGAYNVSLTVTQSGCVSPPTNLPITVNENPVAMISGTPVLCAGNQNLISFTGTSIGAATFTWNFGNAIVDSGNGQGPFILHWNSSGNDLLALLVSQNGCVDSTNFAVTIRPIPTSLFVLPPAACIGEEIIIDYTGNAIAGSSFTWNFGNGNIVSGAGRGPYALSWDSIGSHLVTLIVTQNTCVSPQTAHAINIVGPPLANAGLDTIVCSGATAHIGFPSQGGVAYEWLPTVGLASATSSSTNVSTNAQTVPVEVTYILYATNATGCKNEDTVKVTAYPIPVITFTPPAPQCFNGNDFSFTATGNMISGAQYNWNFGSIATPSSSTAVNPVHINFSAAGIYPVTLNANYSICPAIPYTNNAVVYISAVADFIPDIYEGCVPLTVPFNNLSSGNGNTYQWNFTDGENVYDNAPTHVFNNAGSYTIALIATTTNGCVDDTVYPYLIHAYPLPTAAFTPVPDVVPLWEPLIQFQNSSLGGSGYQWDFGDNTSSYEFHPEHNYTDTGTFEITLYVTTAYGCRDTISGFIRVETDFTFYVPNVFTPNNDGVNDFFQGYGMHYKTYEMVILSRWGILLYSTHEYDKPWNGKVNDPVQNEVYIYKIKVTDFKDKLHEYIGTVTVVR